MNRPIEVLALTRYGRTGSSSRVRFLQFLPGLRELGFSIDVKPLFGDDYVKTLYASGKRTKSVLVRSYFARISALLAVGSYDVIWVEKELLPLVPHFVELKLLARGAFVIDYDDATFHVYDQHPLAAVRMILGSKIDGLMKASASVVAGNDYIARRAREVGARRVTTIPSVVDTDRIKPLPRARAGRPVIGWIGSPPTSRFLRPVAPVLRSLRDSMAADLLIIGSGEVSELADVATFEPWSEAAEADALAKMSIGIMPLDDGPFERGKCGYKIIQYLAAGLPVVASPVGANTTIVSNGRNGFLARTPSEWHDALLRLVSDPQLRSSLGSEGRRNAVATFSLTSALPRLAETLQEAAARGAESDGGGRR